MIIQVKYTFLILLPCFCSTFIIFCPCENDSLWQYYYSHPIRIATSHDCFNVKSLYNFWYAALSCGEFYFNIKWITNTIFVIAFVHIPRNTLMSLTSGMESTGARQRPCYILQFANLCHTACDLHFLCFHLIVKNK